MSRRRRSRRGNSMSVNGSRHFPSRLHAGWRRASADHPLEKGTKDTHTHVYVRFFSAGGGFRVKFSAPKAADEVAYEEATWSRSRRVLLHQFAVAFGVPFAASTCCESRHALLRVDPASPGRVERAHECRNVRHVRGVRPLFELPHKGVNLSLVGPHIGSSSLDAAASSVRRGAGGRYMKFSFECDLLFW